MNIQKLKQKRDERRTFVQNSVNNYINNNKSFAQVVKNTTYNNNDNQTIKTPMQFIGLADELFGIDLPTLLHKINNFIPEYNQAKNKEQRQFKYIEFLLSILQNDSKP